MARFLFFVLPTALFGALTVSCAVFDASLVAGAGGGAGCTDGNRRPASRPPVDTNSTGTDVPDFWIALRDVQLDQGDDLWATLGYDLDDRCTTNENAATTVECLPPQGRSHEVDGNDGIDNAFGHRLFPLLDLAFPGLDETAGIAEAEGLGAVLIRVRGWNGEPEDSSVQLLVTQSVFGTPGEGDGPPDIDIVGSEAFVAGTSDPAPLPLWDGADYFWARDDTFIAPDAADLDSAMPRVTDNNAYVSAGVLYGTIPDGTEVILVGDGLGTRVKLSGVIASGDIMALHEGDAEHITVTIAGRWGYNDLLITAESVGVCPGTSPFNILSQQVSAIQDVLLDPSAESGGSLPFCDAVSIGITFEAYPARVGGIAGGQDLPSPCDG